MSATVVERYKSSSNFLDHGWSPQFELRRSLQKIIYLFYLFDLFNDFSSPLIHTKDENKADAVLRTVLSIQNFKRDTSRKNGRAEGAQLEESSLNVNKAAVLGEMERKNIICVHY